MKTEAVLDRWGTSIGWDLIDAIYELAGINKSWQDYSIPGATDPDNLWDQDSYYAEFDAWWLALPYEEKLKLYENVSVQSSH